MNWKLPLLLSAVMSLAIPSLAQEAAPPPPEAPEAGAPEREFPPPEWKRAKATDRQVVRLASEYEVPRAQVVELRSRGMGWGEIRHALSLSRRSGAPVSEIVTLRDSGMGWGRIAQEYELKLGDRGPRREAGSDELRDAVSAREQRKAAMERRRELKDRPARESRERGRRGWKR